MSKHNPCYGCPDRFPACSGSCRKTAFLEWQAQQETIRKNRRKYDETTSYTADAIRKSRRRR